MILLALLAAATAAQPTQPRLFRDWAAGCDNGRVCEAVSLGPTDGDGEDRWILHLARGAGPEAPPEFTIEIEEGETTPAFLAVDGKKLPLRLVRRGDRIAVAPGDGLVAALRSAARIELLDADGASLGGISLAGASAAMLYLDDRQGRIGTATALARPGPKPAAAVPAPPAWPVVAAVAQPAATARALSAAEARKWTSALCDDEADRSGRRVKTIRIDPRRSLAILPAACLSGEYNDASLLLIGTDGGGWSLAPIDGEHGTEASDRIVFGAEWRGGRIETHMAGRSLGDCGIRQAYAWDGARFRLIDQWEMQPCRGAKGWIRTWHALPR